MIILDTNVISETQRPNPNPNVMAFLESLDPSTTYITAISVAELLYGIDIMPTGKRKKALEDSVFELTKTVFKDRILPFDFDAASHYAIRAAAAKREGNAVSFADGMIAGIVRHHVATIATRDTAPFEAMNVQVINPWAPKEQKDWGLDVD